MDDKQIEQYIDSLPKSTQDALFNSDWEARVHEVGKKYSLTDEQNEDLSNIVSLTIIGIEKPETLLDTVISDLGISKLLAEQVLEDLETRVFEYVLKIIESKEKPKKQNTPEQTLSRVPEVKPDNLPAIEIGEVAKPYTPDNKSSIGTLKPIEPVQKPYSVPRFGMSQVEPKVQVINMTQSKPQSPEGMMATKMGNVTVNMGSDFMQKSPEVVPEAPKMPTTKYSTDPYREPLA